MSKPRLPRDFQEQVALYALGALEGADRRLFEQRLNKSSARLQAEAKAFQAAAAELAFGIRAVAPRASLRERVLAHVAREAEAEEQAFDAVAGELALTVAPVQPRASLRERLLAKIEGDTDVTFDAAGGLTFVKSSDGTWQEMAPGITFKVLFADPVSRRVTALVRMAPGTSYAPHRHVEAEELYVLEGGCFCGGRELTVGDYHRAEPGTEHHDTSSDTGCLLLVISSPQNEMLG
jgi:quercetin dioxygenase-like cupin family protein